MSFGTFISCFLIIAICSYIVTPALILIRDGTLHADVNEANFHSDLFLEYAIYHVYELTNMILKVAFKI